jgi:hypothetical protein
MAISTPEIELRTEISASNHGRFVEIPILPPKLILDGSP